MDFCIFIKFIPEYMRDPRQSLPDIGFPAFRSVMVFSFPENRFTRRRQGGIIRVCSHCRRKAEFHISFPVPGKKVTAWSILKFSNPFPARWRSCSARAGSLRIRTAVSASARRAARFRTVRREHEAAREVLLPARERNSFPVTTESGTVTKPLGETALTD